MPRNGSHARGWQGACKRCQRKSTRAWRAAHPEQTLAANARSYARRDPERTYITSRAWNLRNNYGITAEEFDARLAAQGGCCAMCRIPFPDDPLSVPRHQRPNQDHCHATGENRGILCLNCNMLLGYAKDDPAMLGRAIDYLKEWTA